MPDQMMPLVHVLAQLIQPRRGCRFIFTYDRLMDAPVMLKYCPDAHFIGIGRYLSHRIIWNTDGVAGVARHRGSVVHGIIWEVHETTMTGLDRHYGIPDPFDRCGALIRGLNDEMITAEYYAPRNHRHGGADAGEVLRIIDLASRHDFPTDYVEELKDWFP